MLPVQCSQVKTGKTCKYTIIPSEIWNIGPENNNKIQNPVWVSTAQGEFLYNLPVFTALTLGIMHCQGLGHF